MNFNLPEHAVTILARHKVQDRERYGRNKARTEQIRELKAELARHETALKEFADAPNKEAVPESVWKPHAAEAEQLRAAIALLESKSEPVTVPYDRLATAIKRNRQNEWKPCVVKSKRTNLAQIDSDIEAAVIERNAIADRPRTFDEAKRKLKVKIAALAKPPVVTQDGTVKMPTFALQAKSGFQLTQIPDGLATLAWLFPELIEERLTALLELHAADDAMSAEAQAAALKELDSKLMDLHRERAALVEKVIADGGTAFHRPDAPFEAVLQISAA